MCFSIVHILLLRSPLKWYTLAGNKSWRCFSQLGELWLISYRLKNVNNETYLTGFLYLIWIMNLKCKPQCLTKSKLNKYQLFCSSKTYISFNVQVCGLLLFVLYPTLVQWWKLLGNSLNHLFSWRQSLFFPFPWGHILLATLTYSEYWKDPDGTLR